LTSHVQDDGFREIQLNGKQLFFLFMATTVVSVVIFLCGVLVGRGVRFERTALASAGEEASATQVTELSPAAPQVTDPAPPPVAPIGAPPSSPAGEDELRHVDAVASPTPEPHGESKPGASKPTAPSKPDAQAPTTGKVDKAEEKSAAGAGSGAQVDNDGAVAPPPAGGTKGLVVQVAAVTTRAEADAMAKKLSGKGYAAYVEKSEKSSASSFRVRVGPFATRRDAEATADKLRRQEGKAPWITRG
jgi:DedD protein